MSFTREVFDWQVRAERKATPKEMMEKDEILLIEGASSRIIQPHGWDLPCVTYGFGVNSDLYGLKPPLAVRRPTGGGILIHGYDCSFALFFPKGDRLHRTPVNDFYRLIQGKIAEAVQSFGFEVSMEFQETYDSKDPFCMAKPTLFDLCISGKKSLGGAVRRTKEGLLYQASLPLLPVPNEIARSLLPLGEELIARITERTYPIPVSKQTLMERIIYHVKQID